MANEEYPNGIYITRPRVGCWDDAKQALILPMTELVDVDWDNLMDAKIIEIPPDVRQPRGMVTRSE